VAVKGKFPPTNATVMLEAELAWEDACLSGPLVERIYAVLDSFELPWHSSCRSRFTNSDAYADSWDPKVGELPVL
jgi:hypothetical protein